ncbi:hypothetical protein T190_12260 [Sinorhizobium meliloti CCBAU 01290]|nr:hypothetical protein T190_12260 [Sinorhizobium meliloti CCBAU 01290]
MHLDSMLDQARARLYEAARHLDITADVLEKLKSPRETTQARLVIRMDDGASKSYPAWRCPMTTRSALPRAAFASTRM